MAKTSGNQGRTIEGRIAALRDPKSIAALEPLLKLLAERSPRRSV